MNALPDAEGLYQTLLAGVNQLYAEIGINPRDCAEKTEQNRGKSVAAMRDMLAQAGYHCI